jgi:uncharacterized membrane protein
MTTFAVLSRSSSNKFLVLSAAVLLISLGIFLRFYKLSSQGLWSDELLSASVATQISEKGSWFDFEPKTLVEVDVNDSFLTREAAKNEPPLFDLLLKGWSKLFGVSDFSLRSLSAVLSSGALFVFYFGLSRPLGQPSAIAYAQEVRPYSLALFLTTVAVVQLIRQVCQGNYNDSLWPKLCSYILLSYSHYTGMVTSWALCALYFVLVSWPKRRITDLFKLALVPLSIFPWLWLSWREIDFTNQGRLAFAQFGYADVLNTMIPEATNFFLPNAGNLFALIFVAATVLAFIFHAEQLKNNAFATSRLRLAGGLVAILAIQFCFSIFIFLKSETWRLDTFQCRFQ